VCDRNECGGERARERALQLRLRVVPPEKSGWTVFHLRPEALHRRRTVIQDHTESYIIRISGALAFR